MGPCDVDAVERGVATCASPRGWTSSSVSLKEDSVPCSSHSGRPWTMAMALPITRLDVAKEKPLVSANVNTMVGNCKEIRTFQSGRLLHHRLMFK